MEAPNNSIIRPPGEKMTPVTPPPTHKKGNLLAVILTFIITAVLVGGAAYYLDQRKGPLECLIEDINEVHERCEAQVKGLESQISVLQEENENLQEELEDLSDMTHNSYPYKFSFDYPEDYSVERISNGLLIFKNFNGNPPDDMGGRHEIRAEFLNGDGSAIENDIYEWAMGGFVDRTSHFNKRTESLAGNDFTVFDVADSFQPVEYFLIKDDLVFRIHSSILGHGNESLNEEIISSLEFLDEDNGLVNLETAQVGDKIVGMTITEIGPFKADYSELATDNARIVFEGQATVTGEYHRNDIVGPYCIYNLSESSLELLPRIVGDSRNVGFCLIVEEDAKSDFDLYNYGDEITVNIEDYSINSYPSEVVNQAYLVGIE